MSWLSRIFTPPGSGYQRQALAQQRANLLQMQQDMAEWMPRLLNTIEQMQAWRSALGMIPPVQSLAPVIMQEGQAALNQAVANALAQGGQYAPTPAEIALIKATGLAGLQQAVAQQRQQENDAQQKQALQIAQIGSNLDAQNAEALRSAFGTLANARLGMGQDWQNLAAQYGQMRNAFATTLGALGGMLPQIKWPNLGNIFHLSNVFGSQRRSGTAPFTPGINPNAFFFLNPNLPSAGSLYGGLGGGGGSSSSPNTLFFKPRSYSTFGFGGLGGW